MRSKGIKVRKYILERSFFHCDQNNINIPNNVDIDGNLKKIQVCNEISQKKITRSYRLRCIEFLENVQKTKAEFNITEPEKIWCVDEVDISDDLIDKSSITWQKIGIHNVNVMKCKKS